MDPLENLSPVVTHLATSETLQTGETSLYQQQFRAEDKKEVGVAEGAAYAIGGGLVHAVNTFANSGKAIYNIFGSDSTDAEILDTADVISRYDSTWGAFYKDHQAPIELVSDLAQLAIPGKVAMGLLKVGQKSNAAIAAAREAGQAPRFADQLGRTMDIFNTQNRRQKFIEAAQAADAQAPMFRNFNLQRVAATTAEAVNENTIFTAVAAGMLNQSSLFDDYSAGKFVNDVAFGATITAPLRYFKLTQDVKNVRLEKQLDFNKKNASTGINVNTPADEELQLRLEDAELVEDPRVKMQLVQRAKEALVSLVSGSTEEEKKRLSSALLEKAEGLSSVQAAELFRGTDKIRYFNPLMRAEEGADGIHLNLKTGAVYGSADEITATAGDYQVQLAKGGTFTLNTGEGGAPVTHKIADFFSNKANLLDRPAAEVDGFALSILKMSVENPRAFSVPKEVLGDNKFAFPSTHWAYLQGAILRSVKEGGADMPFVMGDKVVMRSLENMQNLLRRTKAPLVQKALDRPNATVQDINARFGVDTAKLLETNFQDVGALAIYDNPAMVDRYFNPTHVTLQKRAAPENFATWAETLGAYDVKAAQAAREDAYRSIMGPVWREHLDIETLPSSFDTRAATVDSEVAGLIAPGGAGEYLGPRNIVERIGSKVDLAMKSLERKVVGAFAGVQGLDNPTTIAEISSRFAFIRSRPPEVALKVLEDGSSVLVHHKTGVPFSNVQTGGALTLSKEATPFVRTFLKENDAIISRHNKEVDATGRGLRYMEGVLYAPPPDLSKYPYGAFVKSMATGKVGAITAATPEDLSAMMANLQKEVGNVKITTFKDAKGNAALYKEYKSSGYLNDPEFDLALQRRGTFAPAIPRVDERVVQDSLEYLVGTSRQQVRTMVRNLYSSKLDELDIMAGRLEDLQTTIGTGRNSQLLNEGNAYRDLIKTTLNISRADEYTTLRDINQGVERFYSQSIGIAKQKMRDAMLAGRYEQNAEAISEHFKATGQDFDYAKVANIALANSKIPQNELYRDVQAMNGAVALLALGLDTIAPIINVLGMGIVGIPELSSMAKRLGGKAELDSLIKVIVPGEKAPNLPAPTKVFASIIKDMWNPEKRKAMQEFWRGDLDDSVFEAQDTIDNLIRQISTGKKGAITQYLESKSHWATPVAKAGTKLGEKTGRVVDSITDYTTRAPNAWLQIFAHEAAARMGKAAGIKDESLLRAMGKQYSTRVNGNYTASQRGALLQGPLGAALGLFQTWTLGVAQNFARYAGAGEKAEIAKFMGLQSAMFGLQSNPMFKYLNEHLAEKEGPNGDLYQTFAEDSQKRELGEFLLYGIPSSALQLSLYTRGDITPHNPTIIPTEFGQVPIVNATMRAFNATYGAAKRIAADFDASGMGALGRVDNNLMQGIALAGLNRPLAGGAQLYNGYSQFSNAGIGGKVVDPDIMNWSSAARVFGSKPLTENRITDAYYRQADANAKEAKEIAVIGSTIRSRIASGEEISAQDMQGFAASYVAAGGNPRGVRQFFARQMASAGALGNSMLQKAQTAPEMEEIRALMEAYDAPEVEDTPPSAE